MKRLADLSVLIAFAFVLTCGVAHADRQTDPKGLVSFDMPDGWSNDRFKNGRHFTRAGLPDDPNILGVVPEERDEYMTVEAMSDGRKKVAARQEHRLVREKVTRINGFEVWEAVHEARIRGQDVVLHTFLLFSDALMVDVQLNASKPVYEEYLTDLRSLVKTVTDTGKGKLRVYSVTGGN